jgi:N-dimethylarginine dimethylaminohydrolase
MYSVYQHWDPLKVCVVGQSYPPEFYSFITNKKVRDVMERIAIETEEDYQKLIKLLESFNVKVLRPTIVEFGNYLVSDDSKYVPPPMTPRDYSIMLGEKFYFKTNYFSEWERLTWGKVLDDIQQQGNDIVFSGDEHLTNFNSAINTRIGKDVYLGTEFYNEDLSKKLQACSQTHPEYRWHAINTGGHSDATFCPVCPGLIVSLKDVPTYKDTFPDWEVVYLPGQSWGKIMPFKRLKDKNQGKWWVPGEELNDEFTEFVENWLGHWMGYVEETVFDINMLVIDQKNVVCNGYNQQVFDALERHGMTPHVLNFRHRYFWDGGLHCMTSDLHREGTMQNYFPERG